MLVTGSRLPAWNSGFWIIKLSSSTPPKEIQQDLVLESWIPNEQKQGTWFGSIQLRPKALLVSKSMGPLHRDAPSANDSHARPVPHTRLLMSVCSMSASLSWPKGHILPGWPGGNGRKGYQVQYLYGGDIDSGENGGDFREIMVKRWGNGDLMWFVVGAYSHLKIQLLNGTGNMEPKIASTFRRRMVKPA